MNTHVVHGALISTDASFRESVKQVLGGAEHGVELSVEIAIACTEINAAQVEELRRVTLDLILLDLERDPVTGIKFAHFLADLDPHRQLVATGPPLSPDLLLEAMRAGISEYLPKPVTPEALRTGIHRVMRKLGWTPSGGRSQPAGYTRCSARKVGAAARRRRRIWPSCCTGSPARRRCSWTSISTWARRRSYWGWSRGSVLSTWLGTFIGWMRGCSNRSSNGTNRESICCRHPTTRIAPKCRRRIRFGPFCILSSSITPTWSSMRAPPLRRAPSLHLPRQTGSSQSRRSIFRRCETCSGVFPSWNERPARPSGTGSGSSSIATRATRSEERRVGKECSLTCRSRWSA